MMRMGKVGVEGEISGLGGSCPIKNGKSDEKYKMEYENIPIDIKTA